MSAETGLNINPEEIYDPTHLSEAERAVIARIAGVVAREGIPIEQAIIDEFQTEGDGNNDPDDPIIRGLVTGHLLSVAFGGSDMVFPDPDGPESPEQIWLGNFRTRFDALTQLHEGIQWADVERSLKADPEAMVKLQALDKKGHKMNVFGEDGDEFIFASAWDNYAEVSADHRNIVFDAEARARLAKNRPDERCNGNAVDIAKAIGVDLADTRLHEQLRRAIEVNGWAWLKTDAANRRTGSAFCGDDTGIRRRDVNNHDDSGSLRAALRVKKA